MKPFEGFTAETIDFLWELRMNNSREWMEENRDRYKRVLKEPFDSLAAALVAESTAFGGRERNAPFPVSIAISAFPRIKALTAQAVGLCCMMRHCRERHGKNALPSILS